MAATQQTRGPVPMEPGRALRSLRNVYESTLTIGKNRKLSRMMIRPSPPGW